MTRSSDPRLLATRLTAYQRWELPNLERQEPVPVVAEGAESIRTVPPIPAVPVVVLPTVAELEQIHQQAQNEGRESGYQVGYQIGYEQGQGRAVAESDRWAQLAGSLEVQIGQVDQQVVQSLLDLALEVARQMVRESLRVDREKIIPVVREAMGLLPHFNQVTHLVLHPEDAALVRERLGDPLSHGGWKVIEDPRIEPGGCRVDTAHSEIDASLERRWQTVLSSLGRTGEWLK